MSAETDPTSPAPPMPSRPPVPADGAPADRGRQLLRLAVPFYGVVCAFAIGFALVRSEISTLFGEAAPEPSGLVAGLGIGIALVLLTRVAVRAWAPMKRTLDGLADLLGPVAWPYAVVLALTSGFAEELLFRGALWTTLGLAGTTLLFGVVHFVPKAALWTYPLFAVAAGLLLGLLRMGTESLWPPVLAHVTVNALNLAWVGRHARTKHEIRPEA